MKAKKPGVEYELSNFNSETSQIITFVAKDGTGYQPGTTNEEVINMMIDRFYALQEQSFSVENQCVIILLKNVRQLLAKRLSKKIDKVKKYHELADH